MNFSRGIHSKIHIFRFFRFINFQNYEINHKFFWFPLSTLLMWSKFRSEFCSHWFLIFHQLKFFATVIFVSSLDMFGDRFRKSNGLFLISGQFLYIIHCFKYQSWNSNFEWTLIFEYFTHWPFIWMTILNIYFYSVEVFYNAKSIILEKNVQYERMVWWRKRKKIQIGYRVCKNILYYAL